jgi:hypothetical protein
MDISPVGIVVIRRHEYSLTAVTPLYNVMLAVGTINLDSRGAMAQLSKNITAAA